MQPCIPILDRSRWIPRSYEYLEYGTAGSSISLNGGTYTVLPAGGGSVPFTFADPDFNLKSFRGNAVLRWEYLPGSTVYVVWTQTRFQSDVNGDFELNHSFGQMMDIRPDNIFIVKVSYWWNR
jgi:hypothetical protein